MAFNSNEAEKEWQRIQQYRLAAFSYLGVAHYNNYAVVGGRHRIEQGILEKKEKSFSPKSLCQVKAGERQRNAKNDQIGQDHEKN